MLTFLCLLDQGTEWQTEDTENIPNDRLVDALSLPDLSSLADADENVDDGNEGEDAVAAAVISQSFRIPPHLERQISSRICQFYAM